MSVWTAYPSAIASDFLQSAGYRVLAASSGAEALQALQALQRHDGDVHLVLTDVVMPGMSGPELAARITADNPSTRTLFSTGHTDDAALRLQVRDGTRHFIAKPYTLADLTRRVRQVLDAPVAPG